MPRKKNDETIITEETTHVQPEGEATTENASNSTRKTATTKKPAPTSILTLNADDEVETQESKEDTTTQEIIIENNVNYFGYGIMSISAVFLTLTIIFAIILKKHQLNSRLKSSK